MKTSLKITLVLAIAALTLGFTNKAELADIVSDEDCLILHEGTFKYGDKDHEVKVVIKGKNHTEYHENGKYVIKSKLEWVNDCEYNMTMTKITIPNFPYGVGDVMNVRINEVVGNEIYYTSRVKEQSWTGKLIKQK